MADLQRQGLENNWLLGSSFIEELPPEQGLGLDVSNESNAKIF